MEPRAKECLEPPETGRGKEAALSEVSEQARPEWHPVSDFRPPEL